MSKSSVLSPVAPDIIYCLADRDGDFATQPLHNSKDAYAERRAFSQAGLTGIRILKYKLVEEIL